MPFKKGQSGNPGGLTKEQRAARELVRLKLAGHAEKIDSALIALVETGNAPATIYAHQLLHGKEPDTLNVKGARREGPVSDADTEDLIAFLKARKK